jgi:hypothetical protein
MRKIRARDAPMGSRPNLIGIDGFWKGEKAGRSRIFMLLSVWQLSAMIAPEHASAPACRLPVSRISTRFINGGDGVLHSAFSANAQHCQNRASLNGIASGMCNLGNSPHSERSGHWWY